MHTTVTTHVTSNIPGQIYTAMPSVCVIIVYKCTPVHITPDLMIMLSTYNTQQRKKLLVVLSSFKLTSQILSNK